MFMPILYFIMNSLCCMLYRKEYLKYINSVNIEKIQKEKLYSILDSNKDTVYGKKNGFEHIKTIEEYQKSVPVATYEDYRLFIEDIKIGKNNILTKEQILLFELTSGSASASKYIPYTNGLKKEFQKGLKPWIYNLYSSYRGIRWGQSYWSITPAGTKKKYTEGGIPVGFEEDTEYFGKLEKKLFDIVFAVPASLAEETDMDIFYQKTSIYLIKCRYLSLISVWNPTFLLLILEYMTKNAETLCNIIYKNSIKRNWLKEILIKQEYNKIWKSLKVISCWCDGNSQGYKDKLEKMFPGTVIQPKGLLSTEGFISMPFAGENGSRISVNSHFFEFQSLEDDLIYLTHQLQKGKRYTVIITTSGGLYRYNLKDIVEVVGFNNGFPGIKFIGRQDRVSDLFGEKLHEEFVVNAVSKHLMNPEFFMAAPENDRYVLYVKSNNLESKLAEALDVELRENFHYDYCRKLGQLKELSVIAITGNPQKDYLEECVKRGQRLGDIKTVNLALQGGWEKVFVKK
ncbi:MAG: GH3 auxin-responsive promoter family protein [Spirochaetes bacterium]|nr:GH3 auxin-responsive promoter family protein [Spirochaetota bacterium]